MANLNQAIIAGHAGKDAELKFTPNGKAVCKFSIATSSGKDDRKETQWHNVVVWGSQAELAGKLIKKGDEVFIPEGQIKTRMWEKDGHKNYQTEIHSFNFWHRPKEPRAAASDGGWGRTDLPPMEENFEDIPF